MKASFTLSAEVALLHTFFAYCDENGLNKHIVLAHIMSKYLQEHGAWDMIACPVCGFLHKADEDCTKCTSVQKRKALINEKRMLERQKLELMSKKLHGEPINEDDLASVEKRLKEIKEELNK